MTITASNTSPANPLTTPGWTSILSVPILIRAFVVALGLGSILTAINQPEALFGASPLDVLSFALVYITPFAVVTFSQLTGIRQALRDGVPLPAGERFIDTVRKYSIPSRAVLTGLVVGTVNTLITGAAALFTTAILADIPLPLIAQAYILPVLFGLVSQAISYRRAKARQTRARP